jgi:hypothetical protein
MSHLFLACVLFGLCALGCNDASGGLATESAHKAATPASTTATVAPAGQPERRPDVVAEKTGTAVQGDVTGAYFVKGTLPKDFSEIEHLSLATIDEEGKPAPLNGFIRPKRRSAKDYQLVNPQLDGKNLTFSTATVGRVSYRFEGAFERLENFPENPPVSDEVILRGQLTKLLDGKIVVEAEVNFTYSAGG